MHGKRNIEIYLNKKLSSTDFLSESFYSLDGSNSVFGHA